ncbi:hypothetical protein [Pseudomonas sp. UFMG81]|uniref:hypothetical protein n=1 Tax=Pseudomonas sp. UFMG81 TaxID=2745936 RepID=UPI00188E9E1D|nr:hypothetical protein [Pseudomonas sp. UFMG81]
MTREPKTPPRSVERLKVTWMRVLVRTLAAPLMTTLGLILFIGTNYDPTGAAAYGLVVTVFFIPLAVCLGGNITTWVLAKRKSGALRLGVLLISNCPLDLLAFFGALGMFAQNPVPSTFLFATPVITLWTIYLLVERK